MELEFHSASIQSIALFVLCLVQTKIKSAQIQFRPLLLLQYIYIDIYIKMKCIFDDVE